MLPSLPADVRFLEGGAISAPAAIAGAIDDALSSFGVRVRMSPMTAQDVRALLEDQKDLATKADHPKRSGTA